MNIEIQKTKIARTKVSANQLGFGKYFADHMFTAEYEKGAWKNPKITPYGPLAIEPGASVLHYGQAMFEGMKAFRGKGGKLFLFRPKFHAQRIRTGASRICMPEIPEELFLNAIRTLVKLDQDWVPSERGSALYIRPTLIGTESFLGVRPSENYLFFIINSPVSAYYSEGFAPVKIWVEEKYTRAAPGGLGEVKAGANYAASLLSFQEAKKNHYSQVLWLDAAEKKYIEEVGTMNVFFRIGDKVITPALSGTILAGATRDCVITLLKEWGIPLEERSITLEEILTAHEKGTLKEVFGTGTAAVISAVGELATESKKYNLNSDGKIGELTERLYKEITAIQYGDKPDTHGWIEAL